MSIEPSGQVKQRDKKVGEPGGMIGWLAGKPSRPTGKARTSKRTEEWANNVLPPAQTELDHVQNSRSSSIEEKRKRLASLQRDPLNVHQLILKHLRGSARAPITSVNDLGVLIVDSCLNLFD